MREERRREVDDIVVCIDQSLERNSELRRQTGRMIEEAQLEIRHALSRIRAELRRASYR